MFIYYYLCINLVIFNVFNLVVSYLNPSNIKSLFRLCSEKTKLVEI